jgi:methyltransferase (TIGR00027 family)
MPTSFEKVGQTAFVIAQWRAEESESASPLFSDHVANIFLNQETQAVARKIAGASPSTQFLVRYRTRFFDDLFLERMRAGVRQFVLMGAGLDTRSIRLGIEGVKFFEVEQEHVIAWKADKLLEYGYATDNIRMIHADYTRVDFVRMLVEQGFDPGAETVLLWEGNVFYLEYQNIIDVLRILRDHFAVFQIAFDYLSKKLVDRATGFQRSGDLLAEFAGMGAPWRTGIDRGEDIAREVGLTVEKDFKIADYVNGRNEGVVVDRDLLDDYSICVLSNAGRRREIH